MLKEIEQEWKQKLARVQEKRARLRNAAKKKISNSQAFRKRWQHIAAEETREYQEFDRWEAQARQEVKKAEPVKAEQANGLSSLFLGLSFVGFGVEPERTKSPAGKEQGSLSE
jgi:hypothetical protein